MKEHLKTAIFCTILPVAVSIVLSLRHIDLGDRFIYPAAVILLTGLLSIVCPELGVMLYKATAKYAKIAGNFIARVILFFVYVLSVLPLGILMKIVKRDRLRLKKPDVSTYWVDNEQKTTDYEYQF